MKKDLIRNINKKDKKKKEREKRKGIKRKDEYEWMRDEKWKEVLRDNYVMEKEIREKMEEEKEYKEELMKDKEKMKKVIFEEMRGRIKEEDY